MSQTHNLLILELKQTKRKRRMEPKTVPQMQPIYKHYISIRLHCNSLLVIAFVSLTVSFVIQTTMPIDYYFTNSYKRFFIDNEKIWQDKIDVGHSWHSRVKQLENLFSLIFIYSCWRGRSLWGIKTGTGGPHPWRYPILPWLYSHSR